MTTSTTAATGTRPDGLDARTACATVKAITSGELTATAALEQCLEAIERENETLNAIILLDIERAQMRAEELDAGRAAGADNGLLDGLPMTVKEAYHMEGLPTSWGIPEYRNNIRSADSVVVQRLRGAGAVIVGKTNLPQGMEDWESDNENYGSTKNPWNMSLSAGGSSGGGAAAVASGMIAADIGSDTGGSIRIPAHFCGICGIKPTYNLTPVAGHTLGKDIRNQDMNTAGPLCRSPEDIGLIMSAIIGPGEFDAPGWSLSLPHYDGRPATSLRVAALIDDRSCPIDGAYLDVMQAYVENLRRIGVSVETQARPEIDFDRATDVMNMLVRSEGSTRLSDEQFRAYSELANRGGDLTGREYLARLSAQGRTVSHRDWLILHEERLQIRRAWDRFFTSYDAFLCPVSSTAAPPLIERSTILDRTVVVNGEPMPMLKQHFWSAMAVVPYLPALTVPIGQTASGLPVGIDWMGPAYADLQLAGMTADMQRKIAALS
jgi:amidase